MMSRILLLRAGVAAELVLVAGALALTAGLPAAVAEPGSARGAGGRGADAAGARGGGVSGARPIRPRKAR